MSDKKYIPEINVTKLSKVISEAIYSIVNLEYDSEETLLGVVELKYPDFYPERKLQIQLNITTDDFNFFEDEDVEKIITVDVLGD